MSLQQPPARAGTPTSGQNTMSSCAVNNKAVKRKVDQWCVTKGKLHQVTFGWTIANFLLKLNSKENTQYLKSSNFSAQGDEKVQWNLRLYPKGEAKDCDDYVSLFLFLIASDKADVTAKFDVAIINEKLDKPVHTDSAVYRFPRAGQGFGFPAFGLQEDFLDNNSNYLSEDKTLVVQCCVEYEVEIVDTSGRSADNPTLKAPRRGLSHDLDLLFTSMRLSDVTFRVQGQHIRAHKVILASRSDVFGAMFELDMKEKHSDQLDIEDIEPDVFRAMLRFLYTDEMEETEEMAKALLAVSDKYLLDLLKFKCELLLGQQMTVDNCTALLMLADLHSAWHLKQEALDYIRVRSAEVMKTPGWKILKQRRPQLFCDISEVFIVGNASVALVAPRNKELSSTKVNTK